MCGCAATANERGVALSACVLWRWRHNTGSDCKSLYCPPKYCLCGSSLRTSDTGSPNRHCLCRSRSRRTKGPRKPEPAVERRTHQQEQRWQQKSVGSSSTSVLDAGNNTETVVSIHRVTCRSYKSVRRTKQPTYTFNVRFGSKPTCAMQKGMSALPPKADIELLRCPCCF